MEVSLLPARPEDPLDQRRRRAPVRGAGSQDFRPAGAERKSEGKPYHRHLRPDDPKNLVTKIGVMKCATLGITRPVAPVVGEAAGSSGGGRWREEKVVYPSPYGPPRNRIGLDLGAQRRLLLPDDVPQV